MSDMDRDVLTDVEGLITALQAHPDQQVREQVTTLLEGIDAVHRSALTHLIDAIRGMAGEAFINKLIADPAIRLLLMSYDLVAVNRRVQAEEALDAVRGHLHAHGVDVELLDVVGGAIYVRLHGLEKGGIVPEAVRHDLEEALHAGLPGFQELVVGDRGAAAPPAKLMQLGGIRRAQRPVYRRALAAHEVAPGQMKGVEVDDHPVLVANVGGEVYAVRNRCGESPLPLEFGELKDAELRCPWHGCRYDLRSGKRLDGDAELTERLAVFPVAVVEGEIRVAVGVEPVSAG